jgi:hypothetical protein
MANPETKETDARKNQTLEILVLTHGVMPHSANLVIEPKVVQGFLQSYLQGQFFFLASLSNPFTPE